MENPRETLITQQDLQDLRNRFFLLFTHRNLVITISLYNSIGNSIPAKITEQKKKKRKVLLILDSTCFDSVPLEQFCLPHCNIQADVSVVVINGEPTRKATVAAAWGCALLPAAACSLFPWQLCGGLRGGALPVQRPGVVGAAARRAGQGAEHHHHRVRGRAGPAAAAGRPGCLLPQVSLPNWAGGVCRTG